MAKLTKPADVKDLPRWWIRVHLDTTTIDINEATPMLKGNAHLLAREIAQYGTGDDSFFYPVHRIVKVELREVAE